MRKIGLLVLIIIVSVACNLTTDAPTRPPRFTDTPLPEATSTPLPISNAAGPTILPIPGSAATSARSTSVPVTSAANIGSQCEVYITYSGADPNNFLSLRSAPSATASQVFRVPNNTQVLLVPGSEEVEAEGYRWLNVIYVQSAQMRYQGWMARDSYARGGVRDPSIATLRQRGTQAAC